MPVSDVRYVARHGALSQIAKSEPVANTLRRAAYNGARGAGAYNGTTCNVKLYTHNKFRARAVVFADMPEDGRADPMAAALRVRPRI